MKKATVQVMFITILSKFLGFAREMVLSYAYGASAITDAYLVSQTIPAVIFSFISAGITTGYIPLYSKILSEQGRARADRYTSNLSNSMLLLASAVVLLVLILTQPLVRLFASGFSGETLVLAVKLTRLSVFGIYFSGLINIFAGYLRLHSNFIVPALIGFPMNLVIIASLFISANTSVYILALGSVAATVAQLILCIPFVRKTGYRHQANLDLKEDHMKEMVLIALPIIAGTAVNEINVLVDRTLASGIAVGGISSLNYANRLTGFVRGLFVASITTVMYPVISKMAAEGKMKRLKASLAEAVSMVSLLVIPSTVGAMIFSREIVTLLFGRGAFTGEAVNMTAGALFYYSIGMTAFGLRDVLTRAFYALQDTKTPMINATIAVAINIILNIVLSRFLGIGGLALATSIAGTVSAFLMFITLRKKIGPFGLRAAVISFAKIIAASLLMGGIAYASFLFSRNYLSENIALVTAVVIGVLTYGVMILFLRIPEVDRTVAVVKRRMWDRKRAEED